MAFPMQMSDLPEDEPLATPEGDNEDLPDVPLVPEDVDLERPRGDEPHSSQPFRDANGR